MLINAQSSEEVRVAIVEGSTLQNYQVQVADRTLSRGNIYRGTIVSIQPSLNAAFIDYGGERHGFLAIQDVVPEAYYRQPKDGGKRPRIDEVLERGRSIVVQVQREAEGEKGAVLTTNLSLAGRYLVLTPFGSGVGISRKVDNDDQRKRLKSHVKNLNVPEGFGVIVRTNALDQNKTALSRDLAALLRQWKRIETEARRGKGVKLLYDDQDVIRQALRDWLDSSITEVLVDDADTFERAEEHKRSLMPRTKMKLERYDERTPIFSKFDLEPQIERIYDRQVQLPSGGSIVIDRTEALTAIDVNSGRSTKASSQEETAVDTNLEAAVEVARQLRLRDIGGLVVVDFIDMRASKNRSKVEKALKAAMKEDRARFTVNRISSNGLAEINRQRIQQALSLRTHRPCPTCTGTGRIASPEMVGLNLLRKIEGRAASGNLHKVRIALHPELADAFQNHRRREISAFEAEFDIQIEIIASPRLHRPEQEIEWFAKGETSGTKETHDDRETEEASSRGRGRGRGRSSKTSKSSGGGRGSSKDSGGGGRRSGGSGSGSGRKRRSKGSDDSGDSPKKQEAAAQADSGKGGGNGANGGNGGNGDGSDDGDNGSSSGGGRRRRRRRRGGRRRGGGGGGGSSS